MVERGGCGLGKGEAAFIQVYSFIKSQVTYRTSLQSKYRLYEIRPTTQASYTIGSGMTMQANQQAAQIAAEHNIFPQMAPWKGSKKCKKRCRCEKTGGRKPKVVWAKVAWAWEKGWKGTVQCGHGNKEAGLHQARCEAKRAIFKAKNDERKQFCEDLERERMRRAICLGWPSKW